jgi:hypothetical protein
MADLPYSLTVFAVFGKGKKFSKSAKANISYWLML